MDNPITTENKQGILELIFWTSFKSNRDWSLLLVLEAEICLNTPLLVLSTITSVTAAEKGESWLELTCSYLCYLHITEDQERSARRFMCYNVEIVVEVFQAV